MKDINNSTLSIELTNSLSEATVKLKENGKVVTKTVCISDLLTELSHTMETTTGILPIGTRFHNGTKNVYTIGIEVPARVRKTEFNLPNHGNLSVSVPFPEVLFVFHVNNERLSVSRLFCFLPPLGSTYDRLYKFPFGNIYEDGGICWGNVNIPAITEPVILDTIISKFFCSAFSGHLIHGVNMFNPPAPEVVNLKTLLDHLSDKEHFPDQVLKASDINIGKAMLIGKDY